MRQFNTSGPNMPEQHYTLFRPELMKKGMELVKASQYFTIWAPRQTGKSTYFGLLAEALEKEGYKVAIVSFEGNANTPISTFMNEFAGEMNRFWGTDFEATNISDVFYRVRKITNEKFVLIIDEVEGLNTSYFNDFLHNVRKIYHASFW